MPSNLVWDWPLHCNSRIFYIFMWKEGLNHERGHAIIGFNHGLPCYVKNMALGPQSQQKPRPTASVFVYLSASGHVLNIGWQAMVITYNIISLRSLNALYCLVVVVIFHWRHVSIMASRITDNSFVCSTTCSDWQQRKYQRSILP